MLYAILMPPLGLQYLERVQISAAQDAHHVFHLVEVVDFHPLILMLMLQQKDGLER